MPPMPASLQVGKPYPIGAHWDGLGVNFAVFSAHAERVELCLFDSGGYQQMTRLDLPDYTDEIFQGYLPQARPGLVYGYRVHGPYQPDAGHRFNPNKLLLDPYAKKTVGTLHWSDTLFGYRVGSARADLSFDRRDSAAAMPKAVVVDESYGWGNDKAPCRDWADTIIYEAHVRGLTVQNDTISKPERRSFAALCNPYITDHLVKLGITSIELLPIHAYLRDRFLVSKGLSNYWGYSTLSFFSPEPSYLKATPGSADEIRQAVQRLHTADIEIIRDVVYNHTCKCNELGTTLSWRDFDNASYYQYVQDDQRRLINDTGTGNTLNIAHPRVLQMVLDSLRHWAQAYHVDGFRFDRGTTLGREAHGFDPCSGFFDAIRQDPVLSRLKLISEPLDLGPGGYQLSNHPPGYSEWNDRFRVGVRRYWRGDQAQRPELAARLMGSSDIFKNFKRKTWASMNFITSHDGVTLHDNVSYNERHNEMNGEDGNDGHGENISNNWGTAGPTDDVDITTILEMVKRSLLATLFFSHGTPMLLGGDEMGCTQQGNNNAYCQDNAISWVDWAGLLGDGETSEKSLLRTTRRMIALRKQHPSLRAEKFLHGNTEILPGLSDTARFDEQGSELKPDFWANETAQMLSLSRAVVSGGNVDVTYLALNASHEDRAFIVPNPERSWKIELDTATPDQEPEIVNAAAIKIAAHSTVLLTANVSI